MLLFQALSMALGLALLTAGAEGLVRGASRLARALGIPSLVIGLTIVAFGTSAPEIAVSVRSSMSGQGDLALGNVVGSNIFNVLFILGASALVAPLVVARQLIRLDVPVMIGASVLCWLLARDGTVSRTDGLLLVGLLAAYTALQVVIGRRDRTELESQPEKAERGGAAAAKNIAFALGGLVLLVAGARFLVNAAVELARALGVSELVIGLTIVAAGTSLPEVATSIMASLRGERDIAIGNVVGSNLMNILGVLGFSALSATAPLAASATLVQVDMPVMIAVAVACAPLFVTGADITRWEGGLLLSWYVVYTGYLVLQASGSAWAAPFVSLKLYVLLPMTALVLAVSLVRHLRRRAEA
jgi:cation:H+ antiporter